MININEKTFTQEVIKEKSLPVLVDFFANWCGPCRMQTPILIDFANKNKDKIKVCKLDIDECENLAVKYSVSSIPTLILFNHGEIVKKIIGLQNESNLQQLIK